MNNILQQQKTRPSQQLNSYGRRIVCCAAFILSCFTGSTQSSDTGSLEMAIIKTIDSRILGEQRRIFIHTPPGMKPGETYPVLYLLDAEAQMAMVSGQVQYLAEAYKIIPAMIVVGIENTNRTRDLTPTHFNRTPDGKEDSSANAFGRFSGGGEKFLQFLREELLPYVAKNYPAAPYRILAGHSLGGLMALYCLVRHPADFNAYMAISPSLQWDQEFILKKMTAGKPDVSGRLLFFSDANEGGAFHRNQLQLDSLLQQKNWSALKYQYLHYPSETHISEPVKAFYDGIRFFFPDWHLPYNSLRQTLSAAMVIKHFDSLSARYGYTVVPLQDELSAISRFLRHDPKRIQDAIALLEKYIMHYPKAVPLLELQGDIYLKAGAAGKAKSIYEKALSLAPGNESLQKKINQVNQ